MTPDEAGGGARLPPAARASAGSVATGAGAGAGEPAVSLFRIFDARTDLDPGEPVSGIPGQILPGASFSAPAALPPGFRVGIYRVGLIADWTRTIAETDETNNVWTSPASLMVGTPAAIHKRARSTPSTVRWLPWSGRTGPGSASWPGPRPTSRGTWSSGACESSVS